MTLTHYTIRTAIKKQWHKDVAKQSITNDRVPTKVVSLSNFRNLTSVVNPFTGPNSPLLATDV